MGKWQPLPIEELIASGVVDKISLHAFMEKEEKILKVFQAPTELKDEENRQIEAHDIKAALRTLGMVVASLERGYRFDDHRAAMKIESLKESVTKIEEFKDLLLAFYSST